LLSLGLHGAVGWWVLQTDQLAKLTNPRFAVSELRLQATLLPAAARPDLPTPKPPSTQPPERQIKTERSAVRATAMGLQTAERPADRTQAGALGSSVAPDLTASAVAESRLAVPPKLELNLKAAARAVEQLRSKSPLASAIDAQQMQTGAAKMARAFAKLGSAASNIVEETVMADGGRIIRFSGGGCMRVPNPSSRSFDDVRKPAMETC
jgi:hypothetical protein